MKLTFIGLLVAFAGIPLGLTAQSGSGPATVKQKLPLIFNVHFQNFSLPLHDVGSHFHHPGFSLGTELPLNKRHSLYQQFYAGATRNRELGNSFFLSSQFTYRHRALRVCFVETRAGLGWQRIYHPVQAYRFEDGEWKKTAGGKSQLIVPLSVAVGYAGKAGAAQRLSPYLGYQFVPALFYDAALPVNFYSMFNLGARIQL